MSVFAAVLVMLHGVGGHTIILNPEHVTSMRASDPKKPNTYVVEGANCLINLTDGKYVTVAESCEEVKRLLGDRPQ